MHVLLISPTSQMPTILNENSMEFAQLSAMGYQPIQFGTKKELELVEIELMQDFCAELELNTIN